MKRSITESREPDHNLTMANCLMLLSRGNNVGHHQFDNSYSNSSPTRVFECKTCNRQFPSFQALGGHRASHKKPRLSSSGDSTNSSDQSHSQGSPPKPKTHECNICGLEFAIGQALGGHMRRHRAALSSDLPHQNQNFNRSSSLSLSPQPSQVLQVLKKTNSGRRVMCLDLNLTPLENDLEILQLGKSAPLVDFIF